MAEQVEIIFRTKAELAGAQAVQQELERTRGKLLVLGKDTADVDKQLAQVNATLAQAGKPPGGGENPFEKLGKGGNELKKILHEISQESPLLGAGLRLALNPISGAIAAVVLGFKLFKDHIDRIVEDNKIKGEFKSYAEIFDMQAKALVEASLAAMAYERSISGVVDVSKKLTDQTALAIDLEKQRARMMDEERDAETALAKAKVDAAEKTGKITSAEAIQQRMQIENAAARARIESEAAVGRAILERLKAEKAALEVELQRLEAARQAAREKLAGMETPEMLAKRREIAEKNLQAAREEMNFAKQQGPASDRAALATEAFEKQQAVVQSIAGLELTRRDEFNQAKEEADLKEKQAATTRQTIGSLGGEIQKLSFQTEAGISSKQKIFDLGEQQKAIEAATGLGPQIQGAAGAAGALQAEGLSTVESTARAAAAAGIGNNQAAVMQLVERMTGVFNDLDSRNQEIFQLVSARLETIERQVAASKANQN